MHEFRPHLEVLPAAQLRLWSELSAVPGEFVLYGGTAIAEALERAPPGIIDPRSWAYWHSKMGRYPAPPMPTRSFRTNVRVTDAVCEGAAMDSQTDPVRRFDTQTVRKNAVESWKQMHAERSTLDSEELRRRAAAEWCDKFGPGNK